MWDLLNEAVRVGIIVAIAARMTASMGRSARNVTLRRVCGRLTNILFRQRLRQFAEGCGNGMGSNTWCERCGAKHGFVCAGGGCHIGGMSYRSRPRSPEYAAYMVLANCLCVSWNLRRPRVVSPMEHPDLHITNARDLQICCAVVFADLRFHSILPIRAIPKSVRSVFGVVWHAWVLVNMNGVLYGRMQDDMRVIWTLWNRHGRGPRVPGRGSLPSVASMFSEEGTRCNICADQGAALLCV